MFYYSSGNKGEIREGKGVLNGDCLGPLMFYFYVFFFTLFSFSFFLYVL